MTEWTPGPWAVEIQATAQARPWLWMVTSAAEQGHDDDVVAAEMHSRSDARLIALAPKMAEAILAMCPDDDRRARVRFPILEDVAAKLRQIGADE